jgi:hypothetical protein
MTAPETNDEASEHRKRKTAAVSSACWDRPSGMRAFQSW